jgi:hypothetical protein
LKLPLFGLRFALTGASGPDDWSTVAFGGLATAFLGVLWAPLEANAQAG